MDVVYVSSENNIDNILTKPLWKEELSNICEIRKMLCLLSNMQSYMLVNIITMVLC